MKNAVLMEHAREVVQNLRQKYKTGLITNGKSLIQYGKIDQLGIRNDFNLIMVSEEAGLKKPDPRIFEMAAMKLQVSSEQCIYIGDHPVNDIQGAANAGMKTIWIKVKQPWNDAIKVKPIHKIHRLSELFDLI